MRPLLSALLTLTLVLAACGDDDAVTSDRATEDAGNDDPGTPADPSTGDEHEGEGRDPDALFGVAVCESLLPALDGRMEGLDRYATDEVLEQLATFGPADGAETAEVDEGCEIAIGDAWVTLTLLGDGHVGQRAVDVTFDSSEGGDGFDPFLEDVYLAVDAYLASDGACNGDAEIDEDLPNHDIYGLGGGYVVGVICSRAAYQNVHELFGWDGIALVDLTVEQYQDGALVESSFVVGYPATTDDGNLENVEKARGIGDCGVRSLWSLTETLLVLDTAWARECDDDEMVGPEDWPVVYTRG